MIGPSFSAEEIPRVIERIVETYVEQRGEQESFVETVERVGLEPFKTRVYPKAEVAA
ncbi:hypothetical protein D9M71_194400 [compost metagenome]